MTSNLPEPGSELEAEGVPDMQDLEPSQVAAGESHEQLPPPGDSPRALDTPGTTASEQRSGRPIADRLAEEQPDEPEQAVEPPGRSAEESAVHERP